MKNMVTRKKVDSWMPFLSTSKPGQKVARWWENATEDQKKKVVRWMNQTGVKDAVHFAQAMLYVL